MGRRLKRDIAGPDWRRSLDAVRTAGPRGLFAPELAVPRRLVVEIGFGRGEFLLDLARREPEVGFLGVEVSYKRVLKMARRTARGEIENVRLVCGPAQSLLKDALSEASVDAFWINFPDPWPKRRHARRRLFRPETASLLSSRLVSGGELHAATDAPAYALEIDACLSACPGLENAYAPARWLPEVPGRTTTAYELQWRAEGRPLHFFGYRRRRLSQ